MKKFHIVGAFDRHNYGDILFPLIHTRFIQKSLDGGSFDVKYYSITESDLTSCGGLKTNSIKDLLSRKLLSNEVVIMSGGDILGVDWPVMIGQVSTAFTYFIFRVANKLLPFKIINNFVRKMYGYTHSFPYVISSKTTRAKVYYTCVGGSSFRAGNDKVHLQPVCSELKMAEHISVRDKDTKSTLEKYGVCCDLVPDSALIMSDFFTKDKLGERNWLSNINKTANFSDKKYLVFQAGKNYIKSHIQQVIEQLNTIQSETGLSILLLPIGRATGHEDDVVLKHVFTGLRKKGCAVALHNSEHVMDIMASLAFGKCYIGTSLHGAISAYSFGNKVCGFSTQKVKKLRSFMETWMTEDDFCVVDNVNFSSEFLKMVKKGTAIYGLKNLSDQKNMIYSDLNYYLVGSSAQ
jgi:hypothetical protein